jgi:hypothetical protein
MREFRTYGSVRGVPSNGHPYRDYPTLRTASHRNSAPTSTLDSFPTCA